MPFNWLADNWFQLAQTVSILAGLIFGAQSIRENTKTRRLSNLLAITSNHREIWQHYLQSESLHRVLQRWRDFKTMPISQEEEQFITLVILHLKTAYETSKDGMAINEAGLKDDVASFLVLPAPREVWATLRNSFEQEFVDFVEETIRP